MSLKNKINKYLKPFNVQVHGLGYLQSLAKGDFKNNEFDYFKETFGNKAITIFDVGANRGLMIRKFIDYFPNAKIFAFEPIETLCKDMLEQYIENSNVNISNTGIGNVNTELNFYINQSLDTSSFLPSQKTGLNSDAQVANIESKMIQVKTIEKVCEEEAIQHINLLKLDIQGSELSALMGAENLLKEKRIDVIYTEAYMIKQYVNQPLFFEIGSYLAEFGYQLQDIYNPIYGKGKLAWLDAIFVREDV